MHPELRKASILTLGTLAIIAVGTLVVPALLYPVPAYPHEATSTAGQPLGWAYPWSCCSGQDCGPIPESAVKERPDGYHVTILPGQHPMVKTRAFSTVVPYKVARDAPDGGFHLCLKPETVPDAQRFLCFYRGPKGF